VWTDERGDKVFSELSGEGIGPGKLIEGKLIGGTGRYAGISGEYSFKWKRIGASKADELTGRVVGLSGWARLGSPLRLLPPLQEVQNEYSRFRNGKDRETGILLVLFFGLWFAPVPEGLTVEAWHLFAVFASAITSVVLNVFPLFTSALLACAIVVLTNTLTPAKAYGAFANAIVLLVVTAFLVSQSVVKSGLGKRISLYVISFFGKSTLGLAYSIFITDTLIAPGFPSNTARGGVLFPVILALAQNSGSTPDDETSGASAAT
jgi:hypothetical protein